MQARVLEHESNSSNKRSTIGEQWKETEKQKRRILAEETERPEMPVKGVNEDSLVLEEIAHNPLPGYVAPSCISFSPDDRLIAYLLSTDDTLYRKLFVFDLENRRQELIFSPPGSVGLDESNLSAGEKLRRERSRERGLGVTRYEWKTASSYLFGKPSIMVPLPSGVYFQSISGSEPELKFRSSPESPIIDPRLSPDGSMVAYVSGDEIYVLALRGGAPRRLTYGTKENGKTSGLAEYIAQEEMDRKSGFWWSPDSTHIAFAEVDSSEIPSFRIMHQGKSFVGADAQEDHPYPFAGASNVKVRLGVISVSGEDIIWLDLFCGGSNRENDDEYLARVNWMPDSSLMVQVLNRSHTRLRLLNFDIWTGQKKVVLVEEHETWINLHDCFTPLEKGENKLHGGFIWASDKTGFRHLYLHDNTGACLGPITQGDWMVEQIVGIKESAGLIYFTGTVDGPLESNLYSTSLFPDRNIPVQQPRRLTNGQGKHVVILDHQMQRFVDVHDSLSVPPRVLLCSLHDGGLIMPLYEQPLLIPRLKKLQLTSPDIIEVLANDGTILYGALYEPDPRKFGPPPYKTLISVYGGPTIQSVCDSWVNTVDMRAQYLRSKGILVWKLDNRGTARRGIKFESFLKHNLGRLDAEDQLTGAEWLLKQGLAKPGHIGLYGWSYGGFLSALSLARFPDTFSCAVSGAPVSAWDGYDTFYTEKYMGLPSENKPGYEYGSIMHHVHKLRGKLLLVHGMIDENVHFRHTARLINALINAGKPYELLLFPEERHMPRRPRDRVYMEERIWEFFDRNL